MTVNKFLYADDTGSSISVTLEDIVGNPIDLSTAVTVRFIMRGLSNGDVVVNDEAEIVDDEGGVVRYDFTDDDTAVSGDYEMVFRVQFPEGTVTYPTSGPLTLRILNDPSDAYAGIASVVSPAQAYGYAAKSVTQGDITRAQILVGIYIDRDLTNADWLADLSDRDQHRLRQAVSLLAVELNEQAAKTSNGASSQYPENAKSVKVGDTSITFATATVTTNTVESLIPPLVRRILDRLSWRNGKTIRPTSMFGYGYVGPYTTEMAFGVQPIVRGPLPDYFYWREL